MATNQRGILKPAKFTVKPEIDTDNLLRTNGDQNKTEKVTVKKEEEEDSALREKVLKQIRKLEQRLNPGAKEKQILWSVHRSLKRQYRQIQTEMQTIKEDYEKLRKALQEETKEMFKLLKDNKKEEAKLTHFKNIREQCVGDMMEFRQQNRILKAHVDTLELAAVDDGYLTTTSEAVAGEKEEQVAAVGLQRRSVPAVNIAMGPGTGFFFANKNKG